MASKPLEPDAYYDLDAVRDRLGVDWSRQHFYRKEQNNTFPRSVHFGPLTKRWLGADVENWIAARVAEAQAGGQDERPMVAGGAR